MDSSVRTHKRNLAASSLEKNNQAQNINLNVGRLSFGHDYNGPLTLRVSDDSSMHTETFIPSASFSTKVEWSPKFLYERIIEKQPMKSSNLKDNLRQLEQKLNKARWQMQLRQKKTVAQSSNRPSYCPAPIPPETSFDLFICSEVEQDESTMILSSQKKLMSLRSKEKLSNSHKLKEYYIGSLIKGISGSSPLALQHLSTALKISKQAVSLQIPSIFSIQLNKINVPRSVSYERKKTVVIGLNETLLYLRAEQKSPDDIQIGSQSDSSAAFISLRPYAISFLKKISAAFQIIVFSVLAEKVVNLIMEEIDQEHKLICFRITGDSCTSLKNGIVAKDLRALNRSLKDTVIIDSDPQSYLIQPDNAIPILPYRGGNDRELMDLERYLIREILCSGDVREINRHRFKLCNYWQYEDEVDLVKDLYLRENEY